MQLAIEGRRRAAETAHAGRAWAAYMTALLPHMKRPPSLADLMTLKGRAPPEPQTPEQMQANFEKWFR